MCQKKQRLTRGRGKRRRSKPCGAISDKVWSSGLAPPLDFFSEESRKWHVASTFSEKSREWHMSPAFLLRKWEIDMCPLQETLFKWRHLRGDKFCFFWPGQPMTLGISWWSLEWHMAQGEDGGYWHMAWNEEDMWRLLKVAPHWHLADKWEEREMTSGANLGDKAPIFLGFSKFGFFKRKAYVTPPRCGSHIASLLKWGQNSKSSFWNFHKIWTNW